ncbi:hypothetical protein BCCGELA001_23230 [Bradyrhizobium sp. CCGE-LA001]|nr:hypothetical protein BCCGELA001_23230 [Bradyrhizobium sp. CCGE-LA001]
METIAESGRPSLGDTFRALAKAAPSEPFSMQMAPGRLTGRFDITKQSEANKMIEMLGVMKAFLENDEAAN